MQSNVFRQVVTDQIQRSLDMLKDKNDAYNPDEDKLRTFKTAGALQNEKPREALAGMMAKHTASVYDLCHAEQVADLDVWNEKITDHINYLLLLRAVVEEEIVNASSAEEREQALADLRQKLSQ